MTDPIGGSTHALQDAELITRVRAGDLAAFGELYDRHHQAALRYARHLTRSTADADDTVSEAFTRILTALGTGNGPDVAFRPYLLTVVRRTHLDRLRANGREDATD